MTNFQQTLSTITDYIKADIFPGASLALYDGQDWQEHYLGTQDGNHPVVPGLTYDLASVSKVVGVGTVYSTYKRENWTWMRNYRPIILKWWIRR